MTVTTYNAAGRPIPLHDRPQEPPDAWARCDRPAEDTEELRHEFIKDNPAALIEYLQGYDQTLIDDFIYVNLVDYRRWLEGK